jgi:hypothetical protein
MEHGEKHKGDDCCMGMWHKGFKKEFKTALLNKKEKILEAKLEFIREMKKLLEKMSSEEK